MAVADARSEPVAENGTCGKDVIGEAARVGELLADMASSIVHQQAIEDVKALRFAVAGITGLRTAHIGRRRGYRLSGPGYCHISR